jgi:hypothetical protein
VRDDLPTGTVTFLFTDLEGSTKLLHSPTRCRRSSVSPSTRRVSPGGSAITKIRTATGCV